MYAIAKAQFSDFRIKLFLVFRLPAYDDEMQVGWQFCHRPDAQKDVLPYLHRTDIQHITLRKPVLPTCLYQQGGADGLAEAGAAALIDQVDPVLGEVAII